MKSNEIALSIYLFVYFLHLFFRLDSSEFIVLFCLHISEFVSFNSMRITFYFNFLIGDWEVESLDDEVPS